MKRMLTWQPDLLEDGSDLKKGVVYAASTVDSCNARDTTIATRTQNCSLSETLIIIILCFSLLAPVIIIVIVIALLCPVLRISAIRS